MKVLPLPIKSRVRASAGASKKRAKIYYFTASSAQNSIRKTSRNFVRFFTRFWDLGTIWGGVGSCFWRLWATLGGPGRVLEASTRGVFDRVAPRGSQRGIWDHFGFKSVDFGIKSEHLALKNVHFGSKSYGKSTKYWLIFLYRFLLFFLSQN